MSAKLRIKTKGIEIEWEGEVEFLKSEVPHLIASIIEAIGSGSIDEEEETGDNRSGQNNTNASNTFTTASAAAKLQARSASDLLKAVLLKLQMSDGVEPASRARILDEMKLAPRIYRPSMGKNLTRIIDGLLDLGEINEPSSGNYVLSHPTHEQLVRSLSA
ncbi:hypothetical protein [Tardiphaga sp.]|uniref:hypothetical protein n=1 Tax=Tardiphaga sp. TaxID=1926292 RepID=UPI00261E0680|nr:hypothetical protein [Tardiphaga sp.]MDB5620490.1 hypothetical protein [Tardiphaga sp.]